MFDDSVTVRVDGTTIRFKTVDAFAGWLSGFMTNTEQDKMALNVNIAVARGDITPEEARELLGQL